MKKSSIKVILVLALLYSLTTFAFVPVFGYGGSVVSFVDQNIQALDAPLTVSRQQEGSLIQNLPGVQIEITVPRRSFTRTVTIKGSVDDANSFGLDKSVVVGGVYALRAFDQSGAYVNSLDSDLSVVLRGIKLPENRSNLGLYYLDNVSQEWVLLSGVEFDQSVGSAKFNSRSLGYFAILSLPGRPARLGALNYSNQAMFYPNGTLLRTPDKAVYLVREETLQRLWSLSDLYAYRGRKIINIPASQLIFYQRQQDGRFPDGSLLRAVGFQRVYVVESGKKRHILSLDELRYYRGPIFDISAMELSKY